MMTDLARCLWDARRTGVIVQLEDVTEPTSEQQAYAIQQAITSLSGYATRGFKVGSTSKEAQQLLGTTEPGSGPLLTPYMFDSPASVTVAPTHMPAVEGEFAFRLGQDMPARKEPYSADEVAAAIEAVAGSIEVVGTRVAGGLAGKGRFLVTADGGANIAFVAGLWTADWRQLDLKRHQVAMHVNGKVCGVGEGQRALGDPVNVMVWLANQQSRLGRGLNAGECVCTGTCTGIDPVKPGDHVVADFGALGRVEVDFD